MDGTNWKITFNVKKNIDTEPDQAAAAEEAFVEQATVQVEILKVPGKDIYCVDFKRKAGSAILFYDNANKYIDLLELCNNATLEETE